MDNSRSVITLDDLDPKGAYCVVSDVATRASILTLGIKIQREAGTSPDFRKFDIRDPIWNGYVRVYCGKFILAVWRDPTKPELHIQEDAVDETPTITVSDPEEVQVNTIVKSSLVVAIPPSIPVTVEDVAEFDATHDTSDSIIPPEPPSFLFSWEKERVGPRELDAILHKAAVQLNNSIYVQC